MISSVNPLTYSAWDIYSQVMKFKLKFIKSSSSRSCRFAAIRPIPNENAYILGHDQTVVIVD